MIFVAVVNALKLAGLNLKNSFQLSPTFFFHEVNYQLQFLLHTPTKKHAIVL